MDRLRVIFMGSAELACASLAALHQAPFARVIGVVTQPDKPRGRELRSSPTPVGLLAGELKLPFDKPRKARDLDFLERIRSLAPDLIVVVAYGQILPQSLLDIPRHGCLNVHTSILPQYRGAAPIQWAIVDGRTATGVSIMKMDAGLDTGPVVAESRTPITDEDDGQSLHDRLATLGADLLVKTIPDYAAGRIQPVPQPTEGASYARKITKDDGRIDWSKPARAIFNQVRGFNPWPGAFTTLPQTGAPAKLLKVWKAAVQESAPGTPGTVFAADTNGLVVGCGEGSLRVTEVQLQGSRRMPVRDFLLGHALATGSVLGPIQ